MRLIGIDQSIHHTALVITDEGFDVLGVQTIQIPHRLKTKRARGKFTFDSLVEVLEGWKDSDLQVVVAREGPIYGTQATAMVSAGEIGAIVDLACLTVHETLIQSLNWFVVPPSVWRKLVFGHGASPLTSAEKKKRPDMYCDANNVPLKAMGLVHDWENPDLQDAYCLAVASRTIYHVLNGNISLADIHQKQREALVNEKKRKKAKWKMSELTEMDIEDQKKFLEKF